MTIIFYTDNATHTLKGQNVDSVDELQFWGDAYDEALDGSLIQNVRGMRNSLVMNYNGSIEQSEFQAAINDIVAHFDSNDSLDVEFDSQTFSYLVEPEFSQKYKNQRGRFIPSIKLIGQEHDQISIVFLDYGLITSSVLTSLDYGLITDPATTFLDYGSIV